MDTKIMINQLKYEAEKHKNDSLFTGQTNITALCSDVIPKLEKLAEYETAEEEGRLVVLPCKVGDTVYEIRSDYTKCSVCGDKFNEYECQGCEHECDSRKIYTIYEYTMYILEDIVQHIRCNNWGKTIFTTREEAEKALKEMEGK